jgi:hypothetical protein
MQRGNKMELTIKRVIGWYKWVLPITVIIGGLAFFAYYYLPSIDFNVKKENPVVSKIVKGWQKMSGNKQGKVIYAKPPQLVILDLNTGREKEVPGAAVGGAKGRFNRGKSPRPSWSPDGKRFLYRYRGSVFVCDEQGNKKKILNELMDCSDDTRWSWRVENGEDWAVGPSKEKNVIMIKISNPTIVKPLYSGGDVIKHCEMTGTGRYIVYARMRDVFVVPAGSTSVDDSLQISTGQGCRPCAAPDHRVAWLTVPHEKYFIHDARSGKRTGVLHAPLGEEIYRLNWSNNRNFAVHMFGSRGNVRMHVRRIDTGEYIFIGNGWDPDLWIESAGKN